VGKKKKFSFKPSSNSTENFVVCSPHAKRDHTIAKAFSSSKSKKPSNE